MRFKNCDFNENDSESKENISAYLQFLFEFSFRALKEAETCFNQAHLNWKVKQKYKLGVIIPPQALTTLCSIGLAYSQLASVQACKVAKLKKINLLARDWIDPEEIFLGKMLDLPKDEDSFNGLQGYLRDYISIVMEMHSYPVLNRLKGLKVLIDDGVLRLGIQKNDPKVKMLVAHMKELIELKKVYQGDMSFTPYNTGISLALVALWMKKEGINSREDVAVHSIPIAARKDLYQSIEMCSMKRGYYDIISNLYYFYDDFNNNELHFNRAIQMLGGEFTLLILDCLKEKKKE